MICRPCGAGSLAVCATIATQPSVPMRGLKRWVRIRRPWGDCVIASAAAPRLEYLPTLTGVDARGQDKCRRRAAVLRQIRCHVPPPFCDSSYDTDTRGTAFRARVIHD